MFECRAEIDTLIAAWAQRMRFFFVLLSLLGCYIENGTTVINRII